MKVQAIVPYIVFVGVAFLVTAPFFFQDGFVFLLDMVWPPAFTFSELTQHWPTSGFPILAALTFLNSFIPLPLIQKCLLTLLLCGAGVSMYNLARYAFAVPQGIPEKIISWIPFLRSRIHTSLQVIVAALLAGLIFMLNPWVYERLFAGHWLVLAGYAVFPLFIKFAWQFLEHIFHPHRVQDMRPVFRFGILACVYPMISVHWAYIAAGAFVAIAATYGLYMHGRIKRGAFARFVHQSALVLGSVVAANAFWLLFGFFDSDQAFARIGFADFAVFQTMPDPVFGLFGNVMSLYGFWNTGLLLPKDYGVHWPMFTLVLCILAGIGAFSAYRERRWIGVCAALLFVPALVLSLGYAHPYTRPGIAFLYTFFPGFKGLRETEKLVGILACGYALLVPFGALWVSKKIAAAYSGSVRSVLIGCVWVVLLLIPYSMTAPLLGGFSGRVQAREYPAAWYAARAKIDEDLAVGKIMVFPWHGYMSMSFAQHRVIANPAPGFFGRRRTIASMMIENRYVKETDQGIWDVHMARVRAGEESFSDARAFFRSQGVRHVVLLKEADWAQYGFVRKGEGFDLVLDTPEIAVYRLF